MSRFMLATKMLPLPQIYCGGYMYARRVEATLNDVKLEPIQYYVKDNYTARQREIASLQNQLEAAPADSKYVVTKYRDADWEETWGDQVVETFVKQGSYWEEV